MNPVKLFISYAHEDEAFKETLIKHLSGLSRLGLVEDWDDQQINPGKEWDNEIKQALEAADIVVFLVSADFAASDYIHDVEIKKALERYQTGKQITIPVLVRPYDFASLSISKFQALPDNAKAVTSWDNRDEAWLNVTQGIKKIIYEIRGEPLPDNEVDAKDDLESSEKIVLHDFHQYTCDRRQQFIEFDENYEAKRNNKAQFYYLLGEEQQSHFGLVNRLAYERAGHLLDIDNSSPNTRKIFIDDIIVENLSGLEHLKKRLVREFLAKFSLAVNSCDPIMDKNLDFVCKESPVIKKMNNSDYISILLRVYEDEWDEEEIPGLFRWFITEFCSSSLPEDAPTFLFFIGIIYDERDPEIIASVNKVDKESKLIKDGIIKPLPELGMVTKKDITRWFRKYKIIAPDSEMRKSYMDNYFQNKEEFEMEAIQIELKKIIDEFNKPT